MTLLLISIPLMLLAIAIAVMPLAATIRRGEEQLSRIAGVVPTQTPALASTRRRAA